MPARPGAQHHFAKMDADKVTALRQEWATYQATQMQLSKRYNVALGTIGRILRCETWRSVPASPELTARLEIEAEKRAHRITHKNRKDTP